MAHEAFVATIRGNLDPATRDRFDEILARQPQPFASEAPILQALYTVSPTSFVNFVLPKPTKTISARLFGTNKPKANELYTAADRVLAVSPIFVDLELDLPSLAKAWDVVAKAANKARADEQQYLATHKINADNRELQLLRANTQQYAAAAQQTVENIVAARSERFNVMLGLYNDDDFKRRDKRIKEYLFRNENDQIFERLNKKLDKLNSAGLKQVQAAIVQERKDTVKQMLPQAKGRGFVSRRAATAVNSITAAIADSSIQHGYITTPNIKRRNQEAQIMMPADIKFLNEADELFGLNAKTVGVPEVLPGKVIDIKNVDVKDLNFRNFRDTAKSEGLKAARYNITSSTADLTDKGKRGIRILAATMVVIAVCSSIGLAVIFPPTLPFVLVANVFLLTAAASFVYISRDPIPQVADQSKGIVERIGNAIRNAFFPQAKPNFRFEMPADTKRFLQNLDSQVADLLQKHFQERASAIQLAIADHGDGDTKQIKAELDNLDRDWKNILVAANQAAATDNKQEFQQTAMAYLKNTYETVERPQFVELATRKKLIWDSERRIEGNFAVEKNKIEELTKLADKIQHIAPTPPRPI